MRLEQLTEHVDFYRRIITWSFDDLLYASFGGELPSEPIYCLDEKAQLVWAYHHSNLDELNNDWSDLAKVIHWQYTRSLPYQDGTMEIYLATQSGQPLTVSAFLQLADQYREDYTNYFCDRANFDTQYLQLPAAFQQFLLSEKWPKTDPPEIDDYLQLLCSTTNHQEVFDFRSYFRFWRIKSCENQPVLDFYLNVNLLSPNYGRVIYFNFFEQENWLSELTNYQRFIEYFDEFAPILDELAGTADLDRLINQAYRFVEYTEMPPFQLQPYPFTLAEVLAEPELQEIGLISFIVDDRIGDLTTLLDHNLAMNLTEALKIAAQQNKTKAVEILLSAGAVPIADLETDNQEIIDLMQSSLEHLSAPHLLTKSA